MNDKYLILKFLIRNVKDDHLAVYLYVVGQKRTQTTALNNVLKILNQVFSYTFNEQFMIGVAKEYLEYKKYQYINGEIIVKPIY